MLIGLAQRADEKVDQNVLKQSIEKCGANNCDRSVVRLLFEQHAKFKQCLVKVEISLEILPGNDRRLVVHDLPLSCGNT